VSIFKNSGASGDSNWTFFLKVQILKEQNDFEQYRKLQVD
jgi:hypothetical protein